MVQLTLKDGVFMHPSPPTHRMTKVVKPDLNIEYRHFMDDVDGKEQTKLVGGYLRPHDSVFDSNRGKGYVLDVSGRVDHLKKRKLPTKDMDAVMDQWGAASKVLAAEHRQARRSKQAAQSKNKDDLHWTERDAIDRVRVVDPDPINWMRAPWQSAHDGLCCSKSLAFKWNDAKPWDQRGDRVRQNLSLERHKLCYTGTSTSRADYVKHKAPCWQHPATLEPQPSHPLWDRCDNLAQPREQRYYREKPKKQGPQPSLLQWATCTFRSEGHGASA